MNDETRRTAARIAAPIAFLLAVTLAVVLARSGLRSATDESPQAPSATVAGPQVVVVRKGDTLESIAAANGTTVGELRRLNPGVDAVLLAPGRQLRVR